MRTPYQRGTDAERYVIRVLREAGYLCMRAFASKGSYDVLAVAPRTGEVFLIEVKRNSARMSPSERAELAHLAHAYGSAALWVNYHVTKGKAELTWYVPAVDTTYTEVEGLL